jgi:hypothetical protein
VGTHTKVQHLAVEDLVAGTTDIIWMAIRGLLELLGGIVERAGAAAELQDLGSSPAGSMEFDEIGGTSVFASEEALGCGARGRTKCQLRASSAAGFQRVRSPTTISRPL